MKNVDYDRLMAQTGATRSQLDIVLKPYEHDIESKEWTLLADGDEPPDTDCFYFSEYVEALRKTLTEKQDGNPCYMCNDTRCDRFTTPTMCFDRQEIEEDVFALDDDRLEEIVEDTRY